MSVITPQTNIKILQVPIGINNANQITFSSKQSQYNYFNSLPKKELENATYVRENGEICFNANYDEVINYNYVMYQNGGYSDKWFYAFITNVRYISNGSVGISIQTDYYQTWQFDITFKPSFIEREHVNNDTIGLHTIPENVETGEYITQLFNDDGDNSDIYYLSEYYIIVAVSETGLNLAVPSGYRQYNGVYSGLYYLVFKNAENVDKYIRAIQSQIVSDIIYAIFIAPKNICNIPDADFITPSGYDFSFAYYPYSSYQTDMGSISITKPRVIDRNYTPKNNKLLTYPYMYLLVSNNAGTFKDYHYELFATSDCEFYLKGAIGVGCSIKLYPNKYNLHNAVTIGNETLSKLDSIDANKLPTCSWFNDSFTNYLTQNAVNIPLSMIGNIGQTVIGGFTGNGGNVASGLGGIASSIASVYEHSLAPITAKGGVNQSDLLFAQRNTFNYYKMSIKEEYGKIIDGYFSMYGYKVNEVKVPNLTGRRNWNYVKTIGANIIGNIPQMHLQEIKNSFDNGITLWHTTTNFLDYSQNNDII